MDLSDLQIGCAIVVQTNDDDIYEGTVKGCNECFLTLCRVACNGEAFRNPNSIKTISCDRIIKVTKLTMDGKQTIATTLIRQNDEQPSCSKKSTKCFLMQPLEPQKLHKNVDISAATQHLAFTANNDKVADDEKPSTSTKADTSASTSTKNAKTVRTKVMPPQTMLVESASFYRHIGKPLLTAKDIQAKNTHKSYSLKAMNDNSATGYNSIAAGQDNFQNAAKSHQHKQKHSSTKPIVDYVPDFVKKKLELHEKEESQLTNKLLEVPAEPPLWQEKIYQQTDEFIQPKPVKPVSIMELGRQVKTNFFSEQNPLLLKTATNDKPDSSNCNTTTRNVNVAGCAMSNLVANQQRDNFSAALSPQTAFSNADNSHLPAYIRQYISETQNELKLRNKRMSNEASASTQPIVESVPVVSVAVPATRDEVVSSESSACDEDSIFHPKQIFSSKVEKDMANLCEKSGETNLDNLPAEAQQKKSNNVNEALLIEVEHNANANANRNDAVSSKRTFYRTAQGHLIPSIDIKTRLKIQIESKLAGLIQGEQNVIFGNTICDIALSVAFAERRFKKFDKPKVLIMSCNDPNAIDISFCVAFFMAGMNSDISLYMDTAVDGGNNDKRLFSNHFRIELFLLSGKLKDNLNQLTKPDIVVMILNPNYNVQWSKDVYYFLNNIESPVFLIDPPVNYKLPIPKSLNFAILPILPLNGFNSKNYANMYLTNLSIPERIIKDEVKDYEPFYGIKTLQNVNKQDADSNTTPTVAPVEEQNIDLLIQL